MKNSFKKTVLAVAVLLFLSVLTSCRMDNLPKGELQATYTSDDGKYEIAIFLCNGGATVDYSIRGELRDLETGDAKNIYWNYHESEATVDWEDNDTVIINGHKLNLPDDTYDFRTGF